MKANRKFVEEEEAVSAVIGVILMVAITVAIAATVYVYVSGMLGGGTSSTPSISMTAEPSSDDTSCLVTVGTITETGVGWSYITGTLTDITSGSEVALDDWSWRPSGTVSGGDICNLANSMITPDFTAGNEYRFTLAYNSTGGTMGTVKWTQ
jgi:flagellin-like protein